MKRTAAVVIAGVLLLSGCSTDSGGSDALSLGDTKSAAQLWRNTISGKISSDITAAISNVTDASETCDGDSKGLMRLWRSTALTELTADAAGKVDLIQQSISGAFVSKGWDSTSEQLSDTSTLVKLENPTSLATIEITSTAAEDGAGATIYVNIAGPCVETDGPGSDELKQLGE